MGKELSKHHASVDRKSVVSATMQLRKQPLRGQLLAGFSYLGGPARLLYGIQNALTELELVTSHHGLTIM